MLQKTININSCNSCPLAIVDTRAPNQRVCDHPNMKLEHISPKTIDSQILERCPLKNKALVLTVK